MRKLTFYCAGAALLMLSTAAGATTFTFDTDPFAGTNVRNTPGRQIVAGEEFISFSTATDVFSLESSVFGVDGPVHFFNGQASVLPSSGVNVVVLESFDDDNNPATPFGAGNAANLIASHVTTPGAGFFIYFNQALDLPRLVFSTDLSSTDADLKVLARMLNLNGEAGRESLVNFTAANFDITSNGSPTPEPSTILMMLPLIGVCLYFVRRRRAI